MSSLLHQSASELTNLNVPLVLSNCLSPHAKDQRPVEIAACVLLHLWVLCSWDIMFFNHIQILGFETQGLSLGHFAFLEP